MSRLKLSMTKDGIIKVRDDAAKIDELLYIINTMENESVHIEALLRQAIVKLNNYDSVSADSFMTQLESIKEKDAE